MTILLAAADRAVLFSRSSLAAAGSGGPTVIDCVGAASADEALKTRTGGRVCVPLPAAPVHALPGERILAQAYGEVSVMA